MISDAAPAYELPQRPFLRTMIRTTNRIKPPTIHASSQLIGHLPLATRISLRQISNRDCSAIAKLMKNTAVFHTA